MSRRPGYYKSFQVINEVEGKNTKRVFSKEKRWILDLRKGIYGLLIQEKRTTKSRFMITTWDQHVSTINQRGQSLMSKNVRVSKWLTPINTDTETKTEEHRRQKASASGWNNLSLLKKFSPSSRRVVSPCRSWCSYWTSNLHGKRERMTPMPLWAVHGYWPAIGNPKKPYGKKGWLSRVCVKKGRTGTAIIGARGWTKTKKKFPGRSLHGSLVSVNRNSRLRKSSDGARRNCP